MACFYKDVNGVFWMFDKLEAALDFFKAASENASANPEDYLAQDIDVIDGSARGNFSVKCVAAYNKLRECEGVDLVKYPRLPTPQRKPARLLRTRTGRFNPPAIPPLRGTGR